MLICPVCRSQNMDTAKFCGNCGNPFPRPSSPTSSLINCSQGHIYSAVYEHCPYCPQPESGADSNFATRVEEPITAIDPPAQVTFTTAPSDFITRVEANETLFETAESPMALPAAAPAPAFMPTEVIASDSPAASLNGPKAELFNAAGADEYRGADQFATESSQPELPSSPPMSASAHETDRRTIVMAEQASQLRRSKGRIVGWLITYSHNPDGEDFRLYAGYNRLGANSVCDIVLEDETVSGSHAIIVYRDGRCLIKDDLSRNGTFVNGREITESHPLESYDQIRVGNTYLTFVAAQRVA
ncbi:MAG: FHA domain-containing protein [Blastocatellia bacterium]